MQEISKDKFEIVGNSSVESEKISKASLSFWKDVFTRFKKNKLAVFGLVLLILLIVMAFVGPFLTPYNYYENDLTKTNQPPSA